MRLGEFEENGTLDKAKIGPQINDKYPWILVITKMIRRSDIAWVYVRPYCI